MKNIFLQNEKNFYAIKTIFLHNKKYFSRWKNNFYTIEYIFFYQMNFFTMKIFLDMLIIIFLHNEQNFSMQWKILFYTMIIFFPVIWNIQLWKIWNCYRTLSNWKIVFYEIFSGECNCGKNYQCTGCVKLKLIKHVMLTLTSHEEFTFFFFWEINVYFIVWNSYMFNFFGRSFFGNFHIFHRLKYLNSSFFTK